MSTNTQPDIAKPLPELWREWTRIVGQFAMRAWSRTRYTPEEYEVLYHALISCCDSRVESDTPNGEYYRHLRVVAQPWVSLRVLQNTDGELLSHLYSQCLLIDRELHDGKEMRREVTLRTIVLPLLIVLISVIICIGLYTGLFSWIYEKVNVWVLFVRFRIVRLSEVELLLITTVIILGVGWWLISRTRRS